MAFQIEFVSPEELLYSGEGTQVVARTRGGGDIAFLAGHEPFIGSLVPCQVKVTEAGGQILHFAVRSGFVSVDGSKVTVLSDAAVAAKNIDPAKAKADLDAAIAAIAQNPHDEYLQQDKVWAELRLETAGQT